jgi:hypothetical protein
MQGKEKCIHFVQKGREHLGDLHVDRKTKLKRILEKQVVNVWNALKCSG